MLAEVICCCCKVEAIWRVAMVDFNLKISSAKPIHAPTKPSSSAIRNMASTTFLLQHILLALFLAFLLLLPAVGCTLNFSMLSVKAL